MKKAGNHKLLKEINRRQVFECIRKSGVISKADIRNITQLTPTTISEITNSMINQGLLKSIGVAESTGGRPSQLISLNPEYAYFVGIDIDLDVIRVVVLSFDMMVVEKMEYNIKKLKPTETVDIIIELYKKILDKAKIENNNVFGLGISIPGLISKDETIEFAPNLNWREVNLKDELQNLLNIKIAIENESRLSAVAEKYIGLAKDVNNFISINIKSGIGSGIFINGELFKGTSGNAGELGHITVKEDGPLCACGNYGCLETMAATPSIIKRAVMYKKQGEKSLLFDKVGIDDINLKDIVDCSKEGDLLCTRILQSVSKYIGIGISNVINLFNPKLIILGGDIILFKDILLTKVYEILEKKSLQSNRLSCNIKITQLGNLSSAIGAGINVMNKYIYQLLM